MRGVNERLCYCDAAGKSSQIFAHQRDPFMRFCEAKPVARTKKAGKKPAFLLFLRKWCQAAAAMICP